MGSSTQPQLVDAASLGPTLVRATAYAMARIGAGAGEQPSFTSDSCSTPAADRCSAGRHLTAESLDTADVDAVASWFVDQYPRRRYPGVVIGSPHGASAHLAVLLRMPYLPTSFDLTVRWPRGTVDDAYGALAYGEQLVSRLTCRTSSVSVRQIHDLAVPPESAGWPVHLVTRWLDLPPAYDGFLQRCLTPGGSIIVASDARRWPVLPTGRGTSFQVGRAGSGLRPADFERDSDMAYAMVRNGGGEPDVWEPPTGVPLGPAEHAVEPALARSIRQRATGTGAPVQRVLYSRPDALSAGVADVYRTWFELGAEPSTRCVVECGRQLDPWNALRRAVVPYWCESASRGSVAAAEWWLAGSPAFESLDVIPESPGLRLPAFASLSQWAAVARFGEREGRLNRLAAHAYPDRPASSALTTRMLAHHPPRDLCVPGPTVPFTLAALGSDRTVPGLAISRPLY
jgi:hypothetical protein